MVSRMSINVSIINLNILQNPPQVLRTNPCSPITAYLFETKHQYYVSAGKLNPASGKREMCHNLKCDLDCGGHKQI